MEQRLKILDEINTFVNEKEQNIAQFVETLGWSTEQIKKNFLSRRSCQNNTSHLIGASNMKEHLEMCDMSKFKYNRNDTQLPESLNDDKNSTIKIDKDLSREILCGAAKEQKYFNRGVDYECKDERPPPLSYNQMISLYTTDERRTLYDYVVSKTSSNNELLEKTSIINNEGEHRSKSSLEEQAMLRDMKRRRAKHKVSTKSKSYTEIMKNVIENLMTSHEDDIRANHKSDKRKHEGSHHSYDKKKHKSHSKDYEHRSGSNSYRR